MEESKWGASQQVRILYNDVTVRKLDFLIYFFILFVHMVEIRKTVDIRMHAIVTSLLFNTQLLHDTRHFVQSSLGFGYSVKVSFSIVRLFFFLRYL